MLRLEKLELRGFKSFCEPTVIKFHEGITAVVGPNGCGKSNILDAIAWVLGEQSPRSLRGGKMDDVIFNGTRERKPLGMAEVTLTLIAVADIKPRNSEVDDIDIGGAPPEIIDPTAPVEETAAAETVPAAEPPEPVEIVAEAAAAGEIAAGGKRTKPSAQNALKRALAAKHKLPTIAAGERVTISRRLYRSGESDYLMNGHVCRLRDVHDFFAGTGLGGAQYAIIEQGHIGQILSSKPQERRALIEEAAGITKFKAKKHLAELKLEATRQNLSRLNDIISEVERQLNVLKRQAAKARRYRKLREQMREYWRFLFAAEHERIEQSLSEIETTLSEARAQAQAYAEELAERENEHRSTQASMRAKETQLEDARTRATNCEIEAAQTRNRIAYQREQLQEATARITDFARELQVTAERADLIDKEITRRRQDLNKINQELSESELALRDQESAYRRQLEALQAAERESDAMRTQLLAEVGKTERLRHLGQQLEESIKRTALKLQNLASEAARAEERREQCERAHAQLRAALASRSQHVEDLSTRIKALAAQLESEKGEAATEQTALDEMARECARAEDRLASLVELDEQRAYFSEAVQQLMANEQARRDFHLLGTLADFVDVPPQYETMVERVMSERLQAILVPTIDDALAATQWLDEHHAGRATFLITGLHGGDDNGSVAADDMETASGETGEPPVLLSLLGLSSAHAQLIERALPELADARIAGSLAAALELSAEQPKQFFITPAGEQVRACSLLITAAANNSGASVLQLKREIKELTARAVVLQAERDERASALAARRAHINELDSERQQLDSQLRTEERELAAGRVEISQSERELERAHQHIRVVASEREQAEAERAQQEEKLVPVRAELARAEAQRAEIEARVEAMRAEIMRLKPDVEQAAQALAELRTAVAAKLERRRAATQDLRRLEEEQGQLARRSERDRFEMVQLEARSRELQESLTGAESAINEMEAALSRVRTEVEGHEQQLAAVRAQALRLDGELEQLRDEIAQARELRAQADIDRTRLESEAQHLEQACHNELNESLAAVMEAAQAAAAARRDDDEEVPDLAAAQAALEELRARLDELGPVNMMALEELEETEKRYEFLQQQYQDVVSSISATEEALREIKRRSRTRFREAFDQINANFSVVFQELFGGGRGEMLLIDEEDILESGIDIIAQPPGKRLQSVLLLSGGEKAMTALALVLAIFRYRPSPFCVLDEVDAPLDDMNIGRFTEKILQMSEQTQFLVITHSKRTMESASSIYGVTMEEAGVSKLISVRFE